MRRCFTRWGTLLKRALGVLCARVRSIALNASEQHNEAKYLQVLGRLVGSETVKRGTRIEVEDVQP